VDEASCQVDKTANDLGIYIYDLTHDRELVSVNADTPYQYASAFKSAALVYFMSSCRQYWDVSAPEFDTYFRDQELARDPWYASDEYKALIAGQVSNPDNWGNIEAFFANNKVKNNGVSGVIDKRYFFLSTVYSMIATSSNIATGEVLQFVFDNCQPKPLPQASIDAQTQCSGPNAITAFNEWFYRFTGIKYADGARHSGLYNWDTIMEKDSSGTYHEVTMPTSGLKDTCVNNVATLDCKADRYASNAMTPREMYTFYNALYHASDTTLRDAAMTMLKVDKPGAARGFFKNMARNAGAVSMSKNGNAFFVYAPVMSDAGILQYKGNDFIVVVLSFHAEAAITTLYGAFDNDGVLVSPPGLIPQMLDESLKCY
jgi:hypothetical protein